MDPAMYSITPPPDDRMGYSPQLTTGDNLDMNAYPSYGGLHSAIIRPEGEDDDSREAEAAYPTSTRSSSANSPNRAPPGLRRTKPGIGGDDYDPAQTPPMLSTSPAPLPTPRSSFSSSREPTHTLAPFSPPMYPVKNAVSPVPREYSEPSFRSNSSQWLPSIASLNLPAPSWPPAGPAPLPPMNLNRGPTGRSISHDTCPRLPLQR
ncbi:hypothetical protein DL93DRAFT_2076486 [Clavulina sp. PMI_390]|nr:hypothetical protein DL93DRAFT_2076486 [Clavulina sp. PMI_390]